MICNSARERAAHYHHQAGDTYGGKPYTVHLDQVAEYLDSVLRSPVGTGLPPKRRGEALEAAYLHDTVEDTELTEQEIRDEHGDMVADAVMFCTDAEGRNRKERKRATYLRMRDQVNTAIMRMSGLNPDRGAQIGILVKMADRICNLRATLADRNFGLARMYLGERDTFLLALQSPYLPDMMTADYVVLISKLAQMKRTRQETKDEILDLQAKALRRTDKENHDDPLSH